MHRFVHVLTTSAATVLLVAGCSSGASSTEVASLTEGGNAAASVSEATTELTEDAGLEFAQCMRDNGVDDFPDPTVDADGNVTFGFGPGGGGGGTAGGAAVDREAQAAARDACAALVDGVTLGGGRREGLADNTELQDALVAYTDCLRDEGLDVGDFEFGAERDPEADGPPADGGGQRGERGPGRDPGAFIADALGLDTDDAEVAIALESCQPLLDDAFTNFGPGAGDN